MYLIKPIYNYLYSSFYKTQTLENSATEKSVHILMNFPNELLIGIFKHLTFRALITVALVNKKWNLICNRPPLYLIDLNQLISRIHNNVFSKNSNWYSSSESIGFYHISHINECLKVEESWYECNRQLDRPYKINIVIEEIWTPYYKHQGFQAPLHLYYNLDFKVRITTPFPDISIVNTLETALEDIKAKVRKRRKIRNNPLFK